jgi:NitT/TauT family transport system permease protein
MHQYAFEEDERSGERLLWSDTGASLQRLLTALAISAVAGLSLGLAIGVIPYLRVTIAPFVAAVSLIPPLAMLPILFIVVGLGESAKITLIIIGVAPVIERADHQGADPRSLDLAIGDSRGIAADVA